MAVARTDCDGVREATIGVSGDGAYGRLKHESGVHRVQRIPTTESGGRVHTSTASVAVRVGGVETETAEETREECSLTHRAE